MSRQFLGGVDLRKLINDIQTLHLTRLLNDYELLSNDDPTTISNSITQRLNAAPQVGNAGDR